MDFSKISIKQIIPQRPPFLMVDRVVRCNESDALLEFFVTSDNVLVEDGGLSAPGIIENIAQSCAALIGCGCLLRNEPIVLGYIGEVRNAKISKRPQCNHTINTYVHVIEEAFNVFLAEVKVMEEDEIIATTCIKVAKTDIVANLTD